MTATQTVNDRIRPHCTFLDRTEPQILLYNPISPHITLNLCIRPLIANRILPYKFIKKITFTNLRPGKSRSHLRSFTVHKISFAAIYGSLQCYKVIYGSADRE